MTGSRENVSSTPDYRHSHSARDYGECYAATYEKGYYADQWRLIEQPLLVAVLSRLHARKPDARYLDFACGTGRILATAEQVFDTTTGVDISAEMLRVARRDCTGSRIIHRDITQTPLDETFDIVTAFRFFLNANRELTDAVLGQIHTMLNDDGRLVINIHVNQYSPLGIYYAIRSRFVHREWDTRKSLKEMRRALERNGFAVEAVHRYGLLPRCGWHLEGLLRKLMLPVERLMRPLPFLKPVAQCFLLECRKR